jgi:DNA-binding winged helix-turn-helix (wHTH) protein/Tfp pilus assembly protein PilF
VADKYNKTTRYLIDDLNLDVQRGELTRLETVITLPKLSYDLLVALAKSAPALLSQEQLMAIVWPDRVIGDETLKQRVKLLRKSLGDDASAPKYIEAVRGRGYRLIPTVKCECVVRCPPSVMLDLSANDRFPNIAGSQFGKMWRRMSLLGLTVFIGILLSLALSSALTNTSTEKASIKSNVSADEVNIEDSMKTNVERLYLRGRDYYHRYRKQDNDIAIDFFLKAINEDDAFAPAYAALSQAYSQRYFQFSGQESDKQSAIDNAYQALSYDNQSADGYKALGSAYYVAGWLSKSIKTLHRGLAIKADEIEILINLAFIYSEQGELAEALHWHKVILKQAPDHAVAMMHAGLTLQRANQFSAAKLWYQKALMLQPDYLLTTYRLAQLAIAKKDYTEASNLLNQVVQTNTNQQSLLLTMKADVEYFQGNIEQAQQGYQQAAILKANEPYSRANVLAKLLSELITKAQNQVTGDRQSILDEQTISLLKTKQQQGNEQAELSLLLAEIYSAKGQFTRSMRYLTQAIEQGYQLDYWVMQAPLFAGLREQAIFQGLITQQKEALIVDNFFLL